MGTQMKHITVSIDYLDQVEVESGNAARPGDGYLRHGRVIPRVPTRAVEPTLVTVEVSDDRIATIRASWGDRVKRGETPSTYGTLTDGTTYDTYADGSLRLGGRPATDDALLAAIRDTRRQVAEAWLAAIATRPDVAAVVEDYRRGLDEMYRTFDAHYAQWATAIQLIAHKFRRKKVYIGEQTVPGKCCVRSARGALLGYAYVQDGQWLGTVERV
jgi:hypothetical protein